MIHNVNEGNVQWCVQRLNSALGDGQFSTGEVAVALAEFTGRMIVGMADTPVAGFQVAQAIGNHIKDAMIAGYSAKGFNMQGGE